MKNINSAIKIILLLGSILISTHTAATDQELLDTLFENGVLNKVQHEKLSKKAEEKATEANSGGMSTSMSKALDWTSRVNISGDMRFRHENIDTDMSSKGVKESRQRIRARLKVAAKIDKGVDVGFRLVTGGGETSANETLEGSFSGKDVYFDRAFINWHPEFAKGLTAIFGKFKQPWYNVSSDGLIWDSDVNPEGVALKYKINAGYVDLVATGGYFILEDGDTVKSKGRNDGFSDDLNMFHAGLNASMVFTDAIKGTLGSNAYIYNKESKVGKFINSNAIEIYEVAGRVDFDTGFIPVYIHGQYAQNASADEKEDVAWLAGFGAKRGPFNMYYNYRDTQKYAVADTFNDSDFATGKTESRGHKVKFSYKIGKNFATGVAYYATEKYDGINIDTLQLDLKAKF